MIKKKPSIYQWYNNNVYIKRALLHVTTWIVIMNTATTWKKGARFCLLLLR